MRAIRYLVARTFRNQIKELVRTPSRLISLLFIVAMLGLVLFSGSAEPTEITQPPQMLTALVTAFYAVIFFLLAKNGLNTGASFYTMADISLLFSAPISSRTVLLYGLMRQLGTSVLLGFFLVFQYGWLHNLFGLSVGGLLLILAGYAVTIFCAQLTAMLLYSLTAFHEKRHRAASIGYWLLAAVSAAVIAVPAFLSGKPLLEAAADAANAPLSLCIPFAGWLSGGMRLAFGGDLFWGSAGLVFAFLGIVLLLVILTGTETDFYEDVLQATEVSHTAITAKKEGRAQDVLPRKIKLGKTGIGKGSGAIAFYYKHKLENRRARILLLDGMSLIMAVISLVFGFFMRDTGGAAAAFAFACYLQLFTVANGRWAKELLLPYVYLTPQPAFRKLVAICAEQFRFAALEAVVVMIPLGLICGASPLETAAMVVARFGYGVFFIAGNILVERLLGSLGSKTVILMLYFLIMLLLATPGVILAFIAAFIFGGSVSAALLVTLVWNLLLSALLFFLCRNMLSYAELNNR